MPIRRLLLADDDDGLRSVLRDWLTRRGIEVVEASDGPTALHLARQPEVGLSILDFHMPGMNAVEILHELRRGAQNQSALPCILISAEASAAERQLAEAIGAFRFFSKPFAVDPFLECVLDAFARFTAPGFPPTDPPNRQTAFACQREHERFTTPRPRVVTEQRPWPRPRPRRFSPSVSASS